MREESLRVLGEEGHVDYELLKELDTLENTLKETLRLRYVRDVQSTGAKTRAGL